MCSQRDFVWVVEGNELCGCWLNLKSRPDKTQEVMNLVQYYLADLKSTLNLARQLSM